MRELAVRCKNRILLVVLQAEQDAALVGGLAHHQVRGFALAIVFVRLTIVHAEFRTLIIRLGNDVDDATNRIGTVHCRSAIV